MTSDLRSDLAKLQDLLTEFGVEYKVQTHTTEITLSCMQGGTKVIGYYGFQADFYFDLEGKFRNMGVWE